MSTNIAKSLDIESEEQLIDIKFAISEEKGPTSDSILEQAAKIIEAHKQGLTTEYTDY